MASSSEGRGVARPSCAAAIWSAVIPARTSAPSVSFGWTPLSHVAVARVCSPLPSPRASACPWASPLSTTMRSRNGSRGRSVGDSSRAVFAGGVHDSIAMPLGRYTHPSRRTGSAARAPTPARAGVMASSIGRASAAPAPRRNVRLGSVFRVMIMIPLSSS